jgi:hypothetical protein
LSREQFFGSGLSFGSNLPRALPLGLERLRLAFRREIWRSAWKFNETEQHYLSYDAGLVGNRTPIDWRFTAIDCDGSQ